jgi:hypothetical protein
MKKGAKAQLFTLDLLLALIPLTIAMGISANAMSGVAVQIEDYTGWYSNQRIVNEALDAMMKTPGDPEDWNYTYPALGPTTLGLASYEDSVLTPYFIDAKKVGALNRSISGTPLYQLGITALLGANFSYYNFTLKGADTNTTNMSISYSYGSRADVSNIYAAEQIGTYEIEKAMGIASDVGHLGTDPCYGGGGGKPPVWNVDFFVGTGELTTSDFWLYGVVDQSAGANSEYDVDTTAPLPDISGSCIGYSPLPGSGIFPCSSPPANAPGGGSPSCDETYNSNNGRIYRILIDSELVEGQENRVLIEAAGSPARIEDYYIIRAPDGTSDDIITSGLTKPKQIRVILEVGE